MVAVTIGVWLSRQLAGSEQPFGAAVWAGLWQGRRNESSFRAAYRPLRALRWRCNSSPELMVVATTSLRIAVNCTVALANSLRPRTGSRSRSCWARNLPLQRGGGA